MRNSIMWGATLSSVSHPLTAHLSFTALSSFELMSSGSGLDKAQQLRACSALAKFIQFPAPSHSCQ